MDVLALLSTSVVKIRYIVHLFPYLDQTLFLLKTHMAFLITDKKPDVWFLKTQVSLHTVSGACEADRFSPRHVCLTRVLHTIHALTSVCIAQALFSHVQSLGLSSGSAESTMKDVVKY